MSRVRSRPVAAVFLVVGALCYVFPVAAQSSSQEAEDPARVEVAVPDAEPKRQVVEVERVNLPRAAGGEGYPYTVAVPADWSVQRPIGAPGVFLGPDGGDPAATPEMLLVQESDVPLTNPEQVLENLRAHAEQEDWTLLEGEVRDFGGVQGLWIVRRMPAEEGRFPERFSLAVKLPFGAGSINVVSTVPTALYDGTRDVLVKYMLRSIERVDGAGE